MPNTAALKEYDACVDAKKRVILRSARHQVFRVFHQADGTILLKPRMPEDAAAIPRKTLRCIAKSVASAKAGKRSKPVDLKKLAAMKL